MKIVTFGAVILFLTEIQADLSNQPIKIQTLVKKLFNLKPNLSIVHGLGKPLKLKTEEERVNAESQEFTNFEVKYVFPNVTVTRLDSDVRKPKTHYTSLTCDFHQQLKLCQSIDPPDLEIKGIYKLEKTQEQHKPAETFLIRQYDGRMIYQVFANGTNDTDLAYKDQEMKFGETSKNHIVIVRAIGGIIDDINNRTANELNRDNNLANKIKDFEHIFPFISGSLSAINKSALRFEDENVYSINKTKTERWENMYWVLPLVVIRGLNNFKQAKLVAYDYKEGVRFNVTLSTNKLKGYFEWKFGKNETFMISNSTQNFTIDNLTLTANTRFTKDWIVDKVQVDLGPITLLKAEAAEGSLPDINEFAYQIFHQNLETLIKEHLEQLVHEEYSQSAKSTKLNSASTRNPVSNTDRTSTDGPLRVDLLNPKTTLGVGKSLPDNKTSTPCKDDRRWWQKIYRSNKCKQPGTQQTPETEQCADKRWWFQKPFVSNKCVKNITSKSTPAPNIQQITVPQAKKNSNLNENVEKEMEKCVDKRWWFQKAFIRNKCKP